MLAPPLFPSPPERSQPYRTPQFYSGYNELVYGSHEWNGKMPRTIEAFFVVKSQWTNTQNGRTAQRHQQFLRRYGLSADRVPLLTFDASNFEYPFSASAGAAAPSAQHSQQRPCPRAPQWCSTWTCDGASWCSGGALPTVCRSGC